MSQSFKDHQRLAAWSDFESRVCFVFVQFEGVRFSHGWSHLATLPGQQHSAAQSWVVRYLTRLNL